MSGEIRDWQRKAGNIELFEPGKPLERLIIDMITTPIVEPSKRTEYGRKMLMGAA
jgi:hypothetical protein